MTRESSLYWGQTWTSPITSLFFQWISKVTADCCQIAREGPLHNYFSTLRRGCNCKCCCRGSLLPTQWREELPFPWKRVDCPEPVVGPNGCRWLKKFSTKFGTRETRHRDVIYLTICTCVRHKKGWVILIPNKRWFYSCCESMERPGLVAKASWRAWKQWLFHHQSPCICFTSDVPQLSL